MRPASRRRIARACRLIAAVVVAEAAALALLVTASQPAGKPAWRPGKAIVSDRAYEPPMRLVVEPDTGRTYTVAESGSVHLIREGDR
ncbi:hypothetical protein [Olsenella uli]|uniref:hypothetical protein n=1 Tax=Olsenella uli TaxID=133926 RepID=UPI003D7B1D2B